MYIYIYMYHIYVSMISMISPIVYHISIDILCIHIEYIYILYIYHISYRVSMQDPLMSSYGSTEMGTGFMSEMGLAVAIFPANTATSLPRMATRWICSRRDAYG